MLLRKNIFVVISLIAILLMSACGGGATPDTAATLAPMYTAAAQTLQALAGQVGATATSTPLMASTQVSVQPTPTLTATPLPTSTTAPNLPPPATRCDAVFFVGDISIPDGSVLAPSISFTKTWRLRNNGTCTWTTAYALVFTSGVQMGGASPQYLGSNVAPGQTVDISVNLTAPAATGHYRGYWMLQNPGGVRFGFGSQANSAFWVDINVAVPGPNISTTTITADSPDPSSPGQSVAVGVTVSGSATTPTGTVTITGAETNCTITLASGSGSCNVVFNSAGVKTITATYSGDANYAGSADTESHTVSAGTAASTTTITGDVPDPSTAGQWVAVSVTVSGAGIPTPTGTVTITGADTNCSIILAGGTGSCNVVFNTIGVKTLTATYSGDANYAGSSGTASHTVNKGSTTMTITDTPDPSIPGQAVTVSVLVSGAGAVPTGIVAITGADSTCNITLSGGGGSCSVVFYTIGAKTISAAYSGDGNYIDSVTTTSHTVKNTSTTTITSTAPNPSTVGDWVTVNVTVSGAGVTPTGNVEITGADVNCTITLAGGSGSCAALFNTSGSGVKTLTATYEGDGNYVGSSGTANHTVQKGAATVTITSVTPEPSAPYEAVTVTVTVTGAGLTPTGEVAITGADTNCTITLVGGAGTCTIVFNTSGIKTITATYNGDVNYLVNVTTTGHTVT